jgi:hypothetical protein
VSPNNSLDKGRPMEGSPVPELVTTSKEEIEASEKRVEKLQDLLRLAEQGQEDAVPRDPADPE